MILPRSVLIEIQRSTWPHGRAVPASLTSAPSPDTVDVATVLNLIGVLTTPLLSRGASLSELWAFVRYFFAVTEDPDLRLTSEFLQMDPHQKTILSDDFGMGFGMHWLASRLNFLAVCDGRYFIENLLSHYGGTYSGGTAKRGLGKSPDFVAMDTQGRFHIVECKGTQSSIAYRNSQLRDSGMIQKRTITMPANLAGERLAVGIFIGGPSGDASSLRVVDPEAPESYVIRDEDPTLPRSAIARGALAKQLGSAGFPAVSAAIAYPRPRPDIERPDEFMEGESEVLMRRERAALELQRYRDRAFRVDERVYVGRRVQLPLPRPLMTKRGVYRSVEVRRGIERGTFEQVRSRVEIDDVIQASESKAYTGKYRSGETQGRAWVMLGDSYYGDIRLLRD